MSTLDEIIKMQNQGMSDAEISTQLQNNGVSPQEINDSLNQAKIKNAVSPQENNQQQTQQPQAQQQQAQSPGPTTQDPGLQIPPPETYPPQHTEQQPQQDYYQPTPQAYSQQDYYAPQQAIDPETISEIAEQVVTEKLNEFTKKTGDITSFKNTIQDKVADIDERLKRIENSIDNLQQAIVGKIGEFGESNAMIHKDLDNFHGTVSKLMNPLIDNVNEMKKLNNQPSS